MLGLVEGRGESELPGNTSLRLLVWPHVDKMDEVGGYQRVYAQHRSCLALYRVAAAEMSQRKAFKTTAVSSRNLGPIKNTPYYKHCIYMYKPPATVL